MTLTHSPSHRETAQFEHQVARVAAGIPPRAPRRYRQILLAYDGGKHSIAALERVPVIAAPDSEITILTVIPFEAISASPDPIKSSDRDWQWNCLVDATARLRNFGVDPYVEAAAGNPAAVIVETAASLTADLVVLGYGHNRRWQRTLRRQSVRPTLARRLHCDTLIVHALDTPVSHAA
jgi:nucleotide-binding universal stress UspA family protein